MHTKKEMENNFKNYAIIPLEILRDKDLCSSAKLLYGEISLYSTQYGFCWASNKHFAELYGVSVRTIQNWLTLLSEKGYISIKNGNDSAEKGEKNFTPRRKIFRVDSEKNFTLKNINNNNINIYYKSKKENNFKKGTYDIEKAKLRMFCEEDL